LRFNQPNDAKKLRFSGFPVWSLWLCVDLNHRRCQRGDWKKSSQLFPLCDKDKYTCSLMFSNCECATKMSKMSNLSQSVSDVFFQVFSKYTKTRFRPDQRSSRPSLLDAFGVSIWAPTAPRLSGPPTQIPGYAYDLNISIISRRSTSDAILIGFCW